MAMQSIIKPVTAKVKVLQTNLDTVIRGLVRGDPQAKKQVDNLCDSVKNIKADFTSTINTMYASYEASVITMAGLTNPIPMIKIVAFYLQEALAAVELLNSLLKLIAGLLSINTIISMLMDDIEMARLWLNKKMLWLTRALARLKQKIMKEIEWAKRYVMAQANLAYLKPRKQAMEALLQRLKDADNAAPPPQAGINGDYDANGNFVYYYVSPDKKVVNKNIDIVQNEIDQIDAEMEDSQAELDSYIQNDKDFWHTKWDKEAKQDHDDLIADKPTLNADGAAV